MNIEFEYKGIKFSPYRNYTDNELENLWEYTDKALEIGIDFNRDEFYAIAQEAGADVDIFIVETHYVSPMGYCLMIMRPEDAPVIHRITYKEVVVESSADDETSVTELLPAISDEGIQDFYPTPKAVSKLMLDSHFSDAYLHYGHITRDMMAELKKECWEPLLKRRVETILEPSAGRGDLADALKEKFNRSVKIDCIELNPDLRNIITEKIRTLNPNSCTRCGTTRCE